MGRHWFLVAVVAACLGCRSPSCWSPFGVTGTRVPPPATGSYGSPNSYYQPGFPAASGPVSQGPRPLSAISGWTTAMDDSSQANVAGSLPGTVPLQLGRTPSQLDAERSGTGAMPTYSTTLSPSSATRLKGMPVNEARNVSEPRRFLPDETASELKPEPRPAASLAIGTGVRAVQPASAIQASGDSPSAAKSAAWQTRENSKP